MVSRSIHRHSPRWDKVHVVTEWNWESGMEAGRRGACSIYIYLAVVIEERL